MPAAPHLLLLIAQFLLNLRKVKVLAGAALEDVQHIQAGRLEVRCRVVRLRDEDLRLEAVLGRLEVIGNRDELLCDGAEQVQSRLDFVLGIVGLDRGGHHADEPALRRHLMRVADQRDVNVGATAHLLLRNDNLGRQRVLRVGDRMIHQANATNDLSNLADLQ